MFFLNNFTRLVTFSVLLSNCKVRTTAPESETQSTTTVTSAIDFVEIKPGFFKMGSPKSDPYAEEDELQHDVRITKPYLMARYELTQRQYIAIMKGGNPSYFRSKTEQLPLDSVSWNHAQDIIEALNAGTKNCGDTRTMEGFLKAQNTTGCFRLPTEAEWEYAARGGKEGLFPNGKNTIDTSEANFNGEFPLKDMFKEFNRKATVGVDQLNANNGFEIWHMAGNVYEWTQDWYAKDYGIGDHINNSLISNPIGPKQGSEKVLRGGSYYSPAKELRSANRDKDVLTSQGKNIGLRLVRSL